MDQIEIVILFICMILVAFYVKNYYYSEVEYVLSSVDDRYYLVKSLENKQEASNLLANLNKRLMTLVNHIYNLTDDNIVKLEDRLSNVNAPGPHTFVQGWLEMCQLCRLPDRRSPGECEASTSKSGSPR